VSVTKKKKKRMRLPAGIGSVHKVDGKNRRKPYRARVQSHIEFDPITQKATRKYIVLGYYETEADAIEALFEYRKNPYTLDAATYTFADVFKMWSDKKYPSLTIATQRGYNSAFKNSTPLHNMKMKDIRATHLDNVLQNVEGGRQLQARLKTFWGLIFKYAMEYDIIQKNYADFVKTRDKDTGTTRTAIPKEDREKIWQDADNGNPDAKIALIYIYTGMRPSELLEMPKNNVDLQKRIIPL
jgi:integrase